MLTLVAGEQVEVGSRFAPILLLSAALEVNVPTHENVRRSHSLQNPSMSAVISCMMVSFEQWESECKIQ